MHYTKGGRLICTRGRFAIDNSFEFHSGIHVHGSGGNDYLSYLGDTFSFGTVFVATAAGMPGMFRGIGGITASEYIYNIGLHNLTITGSDGANDALWLEWVMNSEFENIRLNNCDGHALYMLDCWINNFKRLLFAGCGSRTQLKASVKLNSDANGTCNMNQFHDMECGMDYTYRALELARFNAANCSNANSFFGLSVEGNGLTTESSYECIYIDGTSNSFTDAVVGKCGLARPADTPAFSGTVVYIAPDSYGTIFNGLKMGPPYTKAIDANAQFQLSQFETYGANIGGFTVVNGIHLQAGSDKSQLSDINIRGLTSDTDIAGYGIKVESDYNELDNLIVHGVVGNPLEFVSGSDHNRVGKHLLFKSGVLVEPVNGGADNKFTQDPIITDVQIAGGIITVTHSWTAVETEGAAATDDLDTINGGYDGMHLYLRPYSTNNIVLKHATGNIWNPDLVDIVLTSTGEPVHLIYKGTGTPAWLVVSAPDRGQPGGSAEYMFSTSTADTPGTGYLRFNSATSNLVTHIYVSQGDVGGKDVGAFLNDLDDDEAIRVSSSTAGGTSWWIGIVTAFSDQGTWYDFTVEWVASAGGNPPFSADMMVVLAATRVSDEPYDFQTAGADWDGTRDVAPSKNATRDQFEYLGEQIIPASVIGVQQLLGRLTGQGVKGISVTELFYNLIQSVAQEAHGNTGAAHTFDMSTTWRHTATVDEATVINVTDPGVDCVCRITLTAAAAWGITFHADTHLDHAANWINGDLPATVPIGRTRICLERVAANQYIASYGTLGAETA